jgi:cation diffusion facilitator CzcD-associated flavoprotein CzcO
MRLPDGARVAIIGAGPSGIVAAKYGVEAGFEVVVFEASDRLGGQWHAAAAHSGVWPGMHTNTSSELTAFSDFRPAAEYPLHPAAQQVHSYLEAYARNFGVVDRVRFGARVQQVTPGWTVDGEPFDAVVVASGRFRKPAVPPVTAGFTGELLHTFDYPGADAFAGRSVIVFGNGISGVEIASDLAADARVISAFRKSRYVIQKVVDGVSSDWQWYTMFGALERRALAADEWARRQRERVLRLAGNPRDFGAPAPDEDLRIAGLSLCQDYLGQIRDGKISCRPGIAAVRGRTVTFSDDASTEADAIICATGYVPDVPYLGHVFGNDTWVDADLYQRTLHPELGGLAVIGQFLLQGPYWPLLELQARWTMAVWSGAAALPGDRYVRASAATPRPPLEAHNALALALADELGVSPTTAEWPDLAEPLLFGPMLPARYRLSGPDARPWAAQEFASALATAPRAPVDPADLETLQSFGLTGL